MEAVKAVIHSSMSVVDVALALFTFMTQFFTVNVNGSSCDGFKLLKLFGSDLKISINSPLRVSFTSSAGGSCTEYVAVSAIEQLS